MPKFVLLSVTAFLSSLRFLLANSGAIIRRVAVPALLGMVAFYLLLAGYLNAVSVHLAQPSGGSASRILGIVALGVLAMLFLHSQFISAVAGVLVPSRGRAFLGIRPHEWRLYVANLQLLLIVCICACVFWPAAAAADFLNLPFLPRLVMNVALLSILFWILARTWFFLLPLSISAGEDEMLIGSWRLSAGHFGAVTVLVLLILLVVLVMHLALQFVFLLAGIVLPLPTSLSMSVALDAHRSMLLPFVLLVSSTYIVVAVLSTLARIHLYQAITGVGDAVSA